MDPTVDHVVTTWSTLDPVRDALDACGLTPEYGGEHDDGTTHMALLGFRDGSYVELIAATGRGTPGRWPDGVRNDAGPYTWAARSADVPADLKRAIDRGYHVEGPRHGTRDRPDGRTVEWDSGVVGIGPDRAGLPFLVRDRTPRDLRVTPTESVVDGPIDGVGQVVHAVADVDRATERYRDGYRIPDPVEHDDTTLRTVPGRPLAFRSLTGRKDESSDADADTSPSARDDGTDRTSWLTRRVAAYGPRPCAFLLSTSDIHAAADRYRLTDPGPWANGRVAWVDHDLTRRWLGVFESDAGDGQEKTDT
jgi:hypothetical protein